MLCDKAYRLRCLPGVVLPGYLELVLNAPATIYAIDGLKTGISDSGVNLTQQRFGNLLLRVPRIPQQEQVIADVDRQASIVDELGFEIAANLLRAERLRQSVLKHVFEGKLVPQDPSDEPASALLERIRASRTDGDARRSRSRPRRARKVPTA
jgi:type I restriction enzyme S subunit